MASKKERLPRLIKKSLCCFLFFLVVFYLVSALLKPSEASLKETNTAGGELSFLLSEDFVKNDTFPELNFFDHGKYRLELELYEPTNKVLLERYQSYQKSLDNTYTNTKFMTFHQESPLTKNKYGYALYGFFGEGKDKSLLGLKKSEGYYYLVKSPNYFIEVILTHTHLSLTPKMKEKEALSYLIPVLESLKENEN